MSFYSNFVIPYGLELVMSSDTFQQYRQELLAQVQGKILEIGFGTGLNLPHYPATVTQITTVDPNPGMQKLARSRIAASEIAVDYHVLNGENLPFADASFDAVVCTWTLCSIPQVDRAIAQVYRLLKPEGQFLFIEHGLSPDSQVQTWQNRLTPIQKVIADGCHLNRNIQTLVEQQFSRMTVEQFYAPKLPKVIGYMYRGIAIK